MQLVALEHDMGRLQALVEAIKDEARPFMVYVLTCALAYVMVRTLNIEIAGMGATLLGWHGYLRSKDKKNGVG